MRTAAALIALVSMALAPPAWAGTKFCSDRDSLHEVTPFVLVGSTRGADASAVRAAEESLRVSAPSIVEAVGAELSEELTICLVGSARSMSAPPGLFPGSHSELGGYAVGGERKAAVLASDPVSSPRLALHELVHLLIFEKSRRAERPIPEWLNEGIAEAVSRRATGEFDSALETSRALAAAERLPTPAQLSQRRWETEEYAAAATLAAFVIDNHGWKAIWSLNRITGKLPGNTVGAWRLSLSAGN